MDTSTNQPAAGDVERRSEPGVEGGSEPDVERESEPRAERVDTSHLARIGVAPGLGQYFRIVWATRDFAVTGALGDLRAQNMNTMLGSLWHLLNPLLLAGVYYIVFGLIFGAADRDDGSSYAAFLVIGIFTFFYSQKSFIAGSRTVIANMSLIQSLQFPRIVLPFSAVVTEAVAHLPAVGMMLVLVLLTGGTPSVFWLMLVPAFVVQGIFNFGMAFVTARVTFHFRDTMNLLPYVSRLMLYLSGVFYGVEQIPEGAARTLFQFNPLFAFIEINRDLLLHGTVNPRTWAIAGGWALGLLLFGFWFFRGKEVEYGRGY